MNRYVDMDCAGIRHLVTQLLSSEFRSYPCSSVSNRGQLVLTAWCWLRPPDGVSSGLLASVGVNTGHLLAFFNAAVTNFRATPAMVVLVVAAFLGTGMARIGADAAKLGGE
jgi:hypothetical protein